MPPTMTRANEAVHPYEVVKHYYGGGMEESRVPGITIREHFAAMAMQGLIIAGYTQPVLEWRQEKPYRLGPSLAERANQLADEQIAALAQEQRK